MAPASSLFIPGSAQENVLTFSADPPREHAGCSHACHYPVRSFYLPVVLSLTGGGNPGPLWAAARVCVCACAEEEHAFLKLNPEHTAVLCSSC